MSNAERDDERALAVIRKHGSTSTSFQALATGLSHWFDQRHSDDGSVEDIGMVAYADTGGAWVAAGEPIAANEEVIDVAERFTHAASERGRRVAFFATEGSLSRASSFRHTTIGEQPVWDPQKWAANVKGHRSMREQLRRARAKGVGIRQVSASEIRDNARLRNSLDAVVGRWLASRPMARMGFLVDVEPLRNPDERLIFVAEKDDAAIALLSLAPVPARGGWLFEHILRTPRSPNGTAELLIDFAMRKLAEDGVTWASLGLAPLAGDVAGWLRAARNVSRPFFNFRGLSAFKRKLRPDDWTPVFLAYPKGASGTLALLDGLRAFAGRPLPMFVLSTALRGPRPLLRALELFLIPWTVALAFVPSHPWFPSSFVHWAWVIFDAGLFASLRWLRKNPHPKAAAAIATAVSVDAILTLLQAVLWTIPAMERFGRDKPLAELAILIACAGPLIAAPVLWGSVRRHQRLRQMPVAVPTSS